MELAKARDDVLDMCMRLLSAGLIVRTWGNLSCRVDRGHFMITPSGKDYRSLRPEDLVIVNLTDGRSWGDGLPSSEVEMHRALYCSNPEANFIIHTHQTDASVLGAFDADIPDLKIGNVKLNGMPCAAYGLPGSDALKNHVVAVLHDDLHAAALMAHHGAVCLGGNSADAFRTAVGLEMLCSHHIRMAYESFMQRAMTMEDNIYQDVLACFYRESMPERVRQLCTSERKADGTLVMYYPDGSEMELDHPVISEEQRTHLLIYEKRPDIHAIRQSFSPATLACSVLREPLAAYLDDFAQINGEKMEWSAFYADGIATALGKNHGVLVEKCGALCCGKTMEDAAALADITEKNARTRLLSEFFTANTPETKLHALDKEDCSIMRTFYLEKYAKRF